MALPVTIVSDVGLAGHHPPQEISSNFFAAVRADADELDVYQASDPTDSWVLKDGASGPVHSGTILGFSTVQDGEIIHIVAWSATSYEYYTFAMDTQLWGIDELIETPTNAPTIPWASIAVRSDGDVIVAYAGDTDVDMGSKKERVDYARREGGTWTLGVALDAGGDVHYGNPNVVLGTNDGMHIIWQRQTDTADPPTLWADIEARTLNSSNSLSTTVTGLAVDNSALLGISNIVSYDDAGTQRIAAGCTGVEGSDEQAYCQRFTEDGSDNIALNAVSEQTIPNPFVNGEVGVVTIAELSGDLHRFLAGGAVSSSDQDIFYASSTDDGATFTGIEELDGVTVNFISAAIYVRGADTVMAYVYDDGGVQKYNEKILIAGAVAQTHQMML